MDHLIKDTARLELFAWLNPDEELPGWDVLTGSPFGTTLPEDQFTTVQNYFAQAMSLENTLPAPSARGPISSRFTIRAGWITCACRTA